uniref:Reverse transcriptase domain-containing protein n=1 Tax=Cannabis sativa TaxID=3483 RepID=A0A803QCK5_CANSA
MASSSHATFDLNEQYALISLEDEEEGILIGGDDEAEETLFDDRWCLVGKFLTGRAVDFNAMRHLMASLWQPGKGVFIKELGMNRYLFQFFHELDVQTVIDGSPWTFNRCPLVFHRLKKGEDPKVVTLHKIDFWVEIHDLKSGFMLERVVRSACGYIATFVKSYPKNFNGIWREYLQQLAKPYDAAMRADLRKKNYLVGAQWLRTGNDDGRAAAGRGSGRSYGAGNGINASPKIMDVDCVDHGGDHDPMSLGKNKKKEIFMESGKDTRQPGGDGDTQSMASDEEINDEEDLVMLLDSKRRRTEREGVVLGGEGITAKLVSGVDGLVGSKNESKDLVVQKKPNYLFLCETLAKKDMVERVRVAIGFEGALAIDCQGKSGGVALLWKDEEDVQVLDYGVSYIDVVICGCDQGHWRLMGLYGDLNNVTSQDDKKGGHPYPRWLVEVFNDTLVDCGLHDLELYGYPYTWERSRGTADRVEREIFWKQRSKQLWLREGDSNSKYFHASTTARRRRNSIQKLKDSAGVWVNWKGRLPSVMVEYFSTLFTATAVADNEVIQCVPSAVTSEHNNRLLEPVSDDEVRHALFQMHPDKSSGHDGMTLGFYQKCWSTVLANRFKDVLPMVISNHQSVFLPGRLISDNIMVAFEIMHYLKRKRVGKEGFMAIKLNMSKAYDQVEWSFIENMLILMGFDQHWVHLIMFCVTTVSYNITHGGHSMGPITPSRGLRQGDPLSPYLFLICAKGLLLLLKHYERHHWLTGCRVARGAPMVSHMLFADDSYVFCKANENEAQNVLRLLHRYELASGQQVNFAKSSVFFSNNITVAVHDRLCGLMRLNAASDDSFYLGLPSIMGRNKNAILGFLKEKLKKKIFSWETKFLSKAGKEVLIKSVAQALPNYAMSVFLLTHEIWSSLEGMMAKFWWKSQSSSSSKGVSWVSWKKLCQHKNVGGLGFRDLRDYNLSFLGKQGWRLLTMEDTLVAKIYKARYYPHGSFLNVELGQNPSFIWRSIWAAQDLVKNGARRSIANGSSVSILHDPWLPNDSNPFVLSNNTGLVDQYVSSLMVVGERSWDVELLCKVFFWQVR